MTKTLDYMAREGASSDLVATSQGIRLMDIHIAVCVVRRE